MQLHGLPHNSVSKESACNAGDLRLIPGLGRSRREGDGYPLQYSGLENPMDRVVLGVAKSWTQQSNFHFHIQEALVVKNSPEREKIRIWFICLRICDVLSKVPIGKVNCSIEKMYMETFI